MAGAAAWAAPPLTTVTDTVYKADGSRFDGLAIIEWRSFDASDNSFVGRNRIQVRVTDGVLNTRLVPTTTAQGTAYYSIRYVSNGNIQFSEFWAVPPSAGAVRVRDIRIPDPLLGPAQAGADTVVNIADVIGLESALDLRPERGTNFTGPRAAIINGQGRIESALGNPDDCVRVDGSTGPCGSSGGTAVTGTFVDGETPGGAANGSNAAFTLSQAPNPAASLLLYRNGMLQKRLVDYDLSGTTITFTAPSIPQPGDILLASYRTAGTGGTLSQVLCTGTGSSTSAGTGTSLGACTIPGGLLKAGDRLEILADYAHTGTTVGYQADLRFGATSILSRTAPAGSAMFTLRASFGVSASGAQWSVQSWGQSVSFAADLGTSGENVAANQTVDFRGQMSGATTETLSLRNFTLVRYPAP
jgi:hypothetical protein